MALALGAGAVGLLAAEAILRFAGLGSPLDGHDVVFHWEPTTPYRADPDDEIGFTLEPGYRGEMVYRRSVDGEVVHHAPVSISADGFRGRGLVGDPAPADATVVLGVGDSLTFGEGVGDDETYLSELERQLDAQGDVRVLNAGVPSWNLAQEVRWIETHAHELEPDLLLVGFYVNDLEVPTPFLGGEFEQLRSLHMDAPSWAGWETGLRSHSRLANLLGRWVERKDLARIHLEGHADYLDLLRSRFAEERGPRLLRESFGRLARHCNAAGSRCVVLLFPLMDTVHDDPLADVLDVARRAALDNGLEVLDVTPALQEVPFHELYVLPADAHPSVAAHRSVGRFVARSLGAVEAPDPVDPGGGSP